MMKKLRLGLIGAGIAARELHGPAVKALADRFEVVAICNRRAERAKVLADWYGIACPHYPDYRDLLASGRVDAVAAAVPIAMNLEVARACVQAGVPAIIEKPIGIDMDEARQMVKLAEQGRITLFIAENFRFSPELLQGKRLMEAGEIGRVGMIRWNSISLLAPDNKYVRTEWRQQPAHLGGFLSDGGVHYVAGMRLLGGDVSRVQAVSTTMQSYLGGADTLLVNVTYRNGLIGQINAASGAVDCEPRGPKVYGDRGTMLLTREQIDVWRHDGTKRSEPVTGPSNFQAEFQAFYEAVITGDRSANSARQAYADLQVIDCAIRSAASGETVAL